MSVPVPPVDLRSTDDDEAKKGESSSTEKKRYSVGGDLAPEKCEQCGERRPMARLSASNNRVLWLCRPCTSAREQFHARRGTISLGNIPSWMPSADLASAANGVDEAPPEMTDQVVDLSKCAWFHGNLTRQQSEILLASADKGAFLMRRQKLDGLFVISVVTQKPDDGRRGGTVEHFTVRGSPGKWHFGDAPAGAFVDEDRSKSEPLVGWLFKLKASKLVSGWKKRYCVLDPRQSPPRLSWFVEEVQFDDLPEPKGFMDITAGAELLDSAAATAAATAAEASSSSSEPAAGSGGGLLSPRSSRSGSHSALSPRSSSSPRSPRTSARLVQVLLQGKPHSFKFGLPSAGISYSFAAESADEKQLWTQMLAKVVREVNTSGPWGSLVEVIDGLGANCSLTLTAVPWQPDRKTDSGLSLTDPELQSYRSQGTN